MFWAGLGLLAAGVILFTFFGNPVRGYIDTSSLFYWWSYLWFVDTSEMAHGALMLGLALLIFIRNLLGMSSTSGKLVPPYGWLVLAAVGVTYVLYFVFESETNAGAVLQRNLAIYATLGVILAFVATFALNFRQMLAEGTESRPAEGLSLITLGLLLHMLGYVAQQTRISILAFLIFALGVAFLMGGRRWGRAIAFPLVIMLFSMPLGFLTEEISFKIRMLVTPVVYELSHLIGIEVTRNGSQLFSPDGSFSYDVAGPCSGIRSLLALSMLSLVIGYLSFDGNSRGPALVRKLFFGSLWWLGWGLSLAYLVVFNGFYQPIWSTFSFGQFIVTDFMRFLPLWLALFFLSWRRLTLLVVALPFALFGNLLRIFLIIVGAEYVDQDFGMQVHDAMGFGIFIIVLGLSMLTVQVIQRIAPERKETAEGDLEGERMGALSLRPQGVRQTLAGGVFGVGMVLILLAGSFNWYVDNRFETNRVGLYLASNEVDPVPLPDFLDLDWIGKRYEVSEVEREILPDDTGFSRKQYVDALSNNWMRQVNVSIVLSGKDRTSIHKPEICLVGQGWTVVGSPLETFRIEGMAEPLRTTALEIERVVQADDGREVVIHSIYIYWFVGGDSLAADHNERMLKTAKERIIDFRASRWAYVTYQSAVMVHPKREPLDEEVYAEARAATLARIEEVMNHTVPEFQRIGFKEPETAEEVTLGELR